MNVPQLTLRNGQTFARKFRVKNFIGRGGMGEVYCATDLTLERQVALKLPLPEFARDRRARQNFMDEARKTARLQHHNIVQIYEADEEPSSRLPYIVMQYLDGGTLRRRIPSGGMEPETSIKLFVQICAGVHYAHQSSILHRDLSPENLMFDNASVVKVTDFGLAKLVENTDYSRSGQFVGKPPYMSPEQWGKDRVDHTTDIYALGIIFYEMLAGIPPFDGRTPAEFVSKHLHDPPPPLKPKIRRTLPPYVEPILQKALAKNKQDRYQSADELAKALTHHAGGSIPQGRPVQPSPFERPPAAEPLYRCLSCTHRFEELASGQRCPTCGGRQIERIRAVSSSGPAAPQKSICPHCQHGFEHLASGGRCPTCGSKIMEPAPKKRSVRPVPSAQALRCAACSRSFQHPASGGRCPYCGSKLPFSS